MGNSYTMVAFSESGGKLNSFGGIKRNYEELQRGSSLSKLFRSIQIVKMIVQKRFEAKTTQSKRTPSSRI